MTEKWQKVNWVIVSEWGVLSTRPNQRMGKDNEIRLTKCSWFGKKPKWDLRNWIGTEIAGQGVVIGDDDELHKLKDMLVDVCKQIDEHPGEY